MRPIGWGVAGLGVMVLAFYFLIFDISVPVGYRGERVVNTGLVSDRAAGMVLGFAMVIAGVLVALFAPQSSSKATTMPFPMPSPVSLPPPPVPTLPPPPAGFPTDLRMAMSYQPMPGIQPSMSLPVWKREVAKQTNLGMFTPRQIEWGYRMDIPPQDFLEFVAYIEAVRKSGAAIPPSL